MRRAARVDANQQLVVRALRELGVSVQLLHTVGKGCPDLIVGHDRKNFLIELKDGSKPPSKQKLTPDEIEWHRNWQGQVSVVASVEEALNICKLS
ncbi:MAG TPA: hypothetical protein V6D15_08510 [Oculatellaceae cyanobacterium]|jgi:Holliday junction resolvase